MVIVIVQVVTVEHYVPTRLVNNFIQIIIQWSISLVYVSIKILIYVKEFIVKTMEFVLFEIPTVRMKVFASVDMVSSENTVNWLVKISF